MFKDIEEAYYDKSDVEKVMLFVLRHYHYFLESDSTFCSTLKSLPFICRHDLLVTPDRFYDPDHELLQRLFYGEENFPSGAYADPAMIAILREIGMRGLALVEPEDILETAYQIQDMSENNHCHVQMVLAKSDALLEYLQKFSSNLSEDDEKSLYESLKQIRWVRRMEHRPPYYPHSLEWFSSNHMFEKPCDTTSRQYTNIAGSALPVHGYDLEGDLAHAFGWDKPPELDHIVQHLSQAVHQYDGVEKAKFMDIASSVYQALSKCSIDDVVASLNKHNLPLWLWHGEGFCSSDQVILAEPFMDLKPYVFRLPTEMAAFTEFFTLCGVCNACHLPDVLKTIKCKYDEAGPDTYISKSEVKRDLHICVSVLNELKSEVSREIDPQVMEQHLAQLQDELVLPLHVEANITLKMAPLRDCTFCDQEWLRQGKVF